MRFLNEALISAGDISGDVTGSSVDSSFMLEVSLLAVVTGSSPNGTLALQGSNDMPVNGDLSPFTPTNWNNVATVTVNSTGTFLIPVTSVSYQWLRAVYTRSSGSGSLTARLKSNGV